MGFWLQPFDPEFSVLTLESQVRGPGFWSWFLEPRSSFQGLKFHVLCLGPFSNYYTVWQRYITKCNRELLQSVTRFTECDRNSLQSVVGIKKSDKKLLETVACITKCEDCCKVIRNSLWWSLIPVLMMFLFKTDMLCLLEKSNCWVVTFSETSIRFFDICWLNRL